MVSWMLFLTSTIAFTKVQTNEYVFIEPNAPTSIPWLLPIFDLLYASYVLHHILYNNLFSFICIS